MFQLRPHFPAAPPPSPADDKTQKNLDINMVIVLAVLLCALVGALAVNSILRCVWRLRRRRRRWWLGSVAGAERGELEEIPVAVFGAEGRGRLRGTAECAICLGEFENGEDLRILPKCNHGFHVDCIDAWLVSHSSCPNCRHSLLLKTAEDGGGRDVRRTGRHLSGARQMSGDIIILIAAI